MRTCKECNEVEVTGIKKFCRDCAYKRKLAAMNRANRRDKEKVIDYGMIRKCEYYTEERKAQLSREKYSPNTTDDAWLQG